MDIPSLPPDPMMALARSLGERGIDLNAVEIEARVADVVHSTSCPCLVEATSTVRRLTLADMAQERYGPVCWRATASNLFRQINSYRTLGYVVDTASDLLTALERLEPGVPDLREALEGAALLKHISGLYSWDEGGQLTPELKERIESTLTSIEERGRSEEGLEHARVRCAEILFPDPEGLALLGAYTHGELQALTARQRAVAVSSSAWVLADPFPFMADNEETDHEVELTQIRDRFIVNHLLSVPAVVFAAIALLTPALDHVVLSERPDPEVLETTCTLFDPTSESYATPAAALDAALALA